MEKISDIYSLVRQTLYSWQEFEWQELEFLYLDEAISIMAALLVIIILAFVIYSFRRKIPGRTKIVLPAVIFSRRRHFVLRTYLPFTLFLLGLMFFVVALLGPYTSFVREEVSYPGRRISILLDASGSMGGTSYGRANSLYGEDEEIFYTAVSAAESFIRMRMDNNYRDLISLIEFGTQSFVVTPFTNDYDNILISISMIAEPDEWKDRFKLKGTVIIGAIEQSVELFKTFGFLEAAGSLIIIFSDGEDTQVRFGRKTLDEILFEARQNEIPVYFIRTAYTGLYPQGAPSAQVARMRNRINFDNLWREAVEKTNGKFYEVGSVENIQEALEEIDNMSAGSINVTRYTARKPRFQFFLLIAVIFWIVALMASSVKSLRRFP